MKKTVLTDKNYADFYKNWIFGKIDNPINVAIKPAYRDLCRTISGFSKREDKIFLRKNAENVLYNSLNELISSENISQKEFDEWHKLSCDKLIAAFGEQKFTYGQAQKWINMSLKYISMIDHKYVANKYEYFHIPIDSYILQATGKKLSLPWSRLENYEEYLDFQNWFRINFDGIPLDIEFEMWLSESQNR